MMDYKTPLKVYISKDIVFHLPEKLDKNASYLINFYIRIDGMNQIIGMKIIEFLDKLKLLGITFKIMPLPRCLFASCLEA